jgi:RNA-directed DNA polymerase
VGAEGKYWFLPGETSLVRVSEESAEAVVAMKAGESWPEQRAEGGRRSYMEHCAGGKSVPTSAARNGNPAKRSANPEDGGDAIASSPKGERHTLAHVVHEQTATSEGLMEKAVAPEYWAAALAAVKRNAGAPGPDGMTVEQLAQHLAVHGETIKRRLLEGRYRPGAARRHDIEKPNGGTRPLSIPNVQDRFVGQLLLGVLQPLFDPWFSAHSYGFRPGRSAHQAVQVAQAYAKAGYTWVVDMDITQFFDRVNHDILMGRLGRTLKDKRMMRIIGAFLRAGVIMPDGLRVGSEEGTPQGGPLSPLLANVYLDTLDRELEKRGLRFVRYADDCNIYVRSEAAAKRVLEGLTQWIARHLRLEVSPTKSGTGRSWERKFLGFVITLTLLIGIAPKSLARFEDRTREMWNARQSLTSIELRDQWRDYLRGWWAYYRLAEDRDALFAREGWVRRHMRKCFWLRWHGAKGRSAALRRLGVPNSRALQAAHASRGAWAMARHPAVHQALSNDRLRHHQLLMPSDLARLDEHTSNRRMRKTARPVVWEPQRAQSR